VDQQSATTDAAIIATNAEEVDGATEEFSLESGTKVEYENGDGAEEDKKSQE
jgi:hypothetical protein